MAKLTLPRPMQLVGMLLAASLITGCATSERRDGPVPLPQLTGEPKNCLRLASISSTRVIDDYTVLFYTGPSEVYVNRLRNRCGGLASQDRFSYATRLSSLCSNDLITVIRGVGRTASRGATCALSDFRPIDKEDIPYLAGRAEPDPDAVTPEVEPLEEGEGA